MPEVPRFAMYSGCVLDQLSWQMQRSGLLTATARLVAQGETIAATTAAGTPTALGLQRFGHFNGTVKRNGTAAGQCRLGRDHLFQQPRPDRDHPRRWPHRWGRPHHGRADRPDRGALCRQHAGHAGHRRHALRAGVHLQPRGQRQLHLHRPRRLSAAPPHRDRRARRACRPPSTGRPPRPPAPPACAPPSSSTPSQDTDHDPTEPDRHARMAGPRPRPAPAGRAR